jgi:hypothetical protein
VPSGSTDPPGLSGIRPPAETPRDHGLAPPRRDAGRSGPPGDADLDGHRCGCRRKAGRQEDKDRGGPRCLLRSRANRDALLPQSVPTTSTATTLFGSSGLCTRTQSHPSASAASGYPQATFAQEQLIDELAGRLGIDPVEMRRRNASLTGDKTISRVADRQLRSRPLPRRDQ